MVVRCSALLMLYLPSLKAGWAAFTQLAVLEPLVGGVREGLAFFLVKTRLRLFALILNQIFLSFDLCSPFRAFIFKRFFCISAR